jgi:LysR family hydrogen peroxide-inducible transcriptional activator
LAARFGAEVMRDYQGTSLDALRLMVVMGMGVAFLPALYIHSEIRSDSSVVVREIEGYSVARVVGLSWRQSAPSRGFFRALTRDLRRVVRSEVGAIVKVIDRKR